MSYKALLHDIPYHFSSRTLTNWNPQDTTQTQYHPKLDTLLTMLEDLPGNAFVFINKEGVLLDDKGSRSLRFLKRLIEQRFRGRASSRLKNVRVELLHKETLQHESPESPNSPDNAIPLSNSLQNPLPIPLHKRLNVLNQTLLATREDIVLIGSTEVMEGLTMNEIRQVHLVEPSWNQSTMDQVMGRAVRIRNHRKYTDTRMHNVVCCVHVTVPDDPEAMRAHLEQQTKTTSQGSTLRYTTPLLARHIGDLHRYYFVQRKQRMILRALRHIRQVAWDAVMQPLHHERREGVLAHRATDMDSCSWRFIKMRCVDDAVAERVKTLRQMLRDTAPLPSGAPATMFPRESLRNEIDGLSRGIVRYFEQVAVPRCTFRELWSRVPPYGRLIGTDSPSPLSTPLSSFLSTPLPVQVNVEAYRAWAYSVSEPSIQSSLSRCNTLDEVLTVVSTPPLVPARLKVLNALLRDITLSQYLWHVRTNTSSSSSSSSSSITLEVDPVSVLSSPSWDTRAPAKTLEELRTRIPTDQRDVLAMVTKTYIVPNHSTYSPTQTGGRRKSRRNSRRRTRSARKRSQKRPRSPSTTSSPTPSSTPSLPSPSASFSTQHPNLLLQHIRPDALEYALHDLIRNHTPVVRPGGVVHAVVQHGDLYTLQRIDMAPGSDQWNVPMDDTTVQEEVNRPPVDPVPFSVPVQTHSHISDADVRDLVAQWIRYTQAYAQMSQNAGCVLSDTPLQVYTLEHIFDRMRISDQDAILRYFARYGLDHSALTEHLSQPLSGCTDWSTVWIPLVRQAIGHRWIEKGAKQTECYPESATDVLLACFPHTAGRIYIQFARDPAKHPGQIHVYTSTLTQGKQQSSRSYQLDTQRLTQNPLAAQRVLAYFSPRPVLQPLPGDTFLSSSTVTRTAQPPLTQNTQLFAYNPVFHFTKSDAPFLHQPKLCAGRTLRDVPLLPDEAATTSTPVTHPSNTTSPINTLNQVATHNKSFQGVVPKTMTVSEFETALQHQYHLYTTTTNNTSTTTNTFADPPHLPINLYHYARYLLLRHAGVYLRYFYPYVLAKHPTTEEKYAEYKLVDKPNST